MELGVINFERDPLKETSIVKTGVELDFHAFLVGNRKNIGLQKGKKREIFMQQRRKSHLSHWKRYVAASRKVSILKDKWWCRK